MRLQWYPMISRCFKKRICDPPMGFAEHRRHARRAFVQRWQPIGVQSTFSRWNVKIQNLTHTVARNTFARRTLGHSFDLSSTINSPRERFTISRFISLRRTYLSSLYFLLSSWSREKYLNGTVINIRSLVALLNFKRLIVSAFFLLSYLRFRVSASYNR